MRSRTSPSGPSRTTRTKRTKRTSEKVQKAWIVTPSAEEARGQQRQESRIEGPTATSAHIRLVFGRRFEFAEAIVTFPPRLEAPSPQIGRRAPRLRSSGLALSCVNGATDQPRLWVS